MLFHFPTALVTTREDEEAFLSYGACESALIVMHRIFTLALQGMTHVPLMPKDRRG